MARVSRFRRVRALLTVLALVGAVVAAMPSPQPVQAKPVEAGWLAGDLHVHTYYSHDVCQTPALQHNGDPCEDPYVWGFPPRGQIKNAEQRGLDYVVLTDHNTVEQQSDPGYWSDSVTLVPGYENSLNGHAQMLGATKVYAKGSGSPADINAMVDALHADGGLFQANHPMDPKWGYTIDQVPNVDTIEVWNLPWPAQSDIMGDWNVASNNPQSVKLWESWLDGGHHVAATGGSDSHWRSTYAVQGVGEPTTWVYSTDRSVGGILAGIKAGRTFITATPPLLKPAMLYLEADQDANGGFEAMVGDTVSAASTFRVRVRRGLGNVVRLVTTGGHTLATALVTSNDFTQEFTVPAGTTWVRAELYIHDVSKNREGLCLPGTLPQDDGPRCFEDHYWMSALTSAIYTQ